MSENGYLARLTRIPATISDTGTWPGSSGYQLLNYQIQVLSLAHPDTSYFIRYRYLARLIRILATKSETGIWPGSSGYQLLYYQIQIHPDTSYFIRYLLKNQIKVLGLDHPDPSYYISCRNSVWLI